MGAGDRFKFWMNPNSIGLGLAFSNFPHTLSIHANVLVFNLYIGFGKAYHE